MKVDTANWTKVHANIRKRLSKFISFLFPRIYNNTNTFYSNFSLISSIWNMKAFVLEWCNKSFIIKRTSKQRRQARVGGWLQPWREVARKRTRPDHRTAAGILSWDAATPRVRSRDVLSAASRLRPGRSQLAAQKRNRLVHCGLDQSLVVLA